MATLADLKIRYIESSDYAETGDLEKAKRFRTVVNQLLVLRPRRVRHAGTQEVEFDTEALQKQLTSVDDFINARTLATQTSRTYFDLSRFRG